MPDQPSPPQQEQPQVTPQGPGTRRTQQSLRHRALGMAALCLAIATTLAAGGTLALASVLYAPIEKATTLSACERGSLTFAQEHVSTVVVNLKFLVIMGSPVAGLLTLTIAIIAIALDRGRRLGQVAILILVAAAIDGFAMLLFAFPMDPVRWHMTCGGG